MMKLTSKFIAAGAGCLALTSLCGPLARATDILNDPADSVTAANSSTQTGRISRNGTQQTWDPAVSGEAAYPGAINTTTAYNYVSYTFSAAQLGNGQFVQINFDEPLAADLFVSAWTTFNGTSSLTSGAGFLGDAGQSEDYAFGSIPPTPQDPRFFNVTVPAGSSLTVVVNTTSAAALGENYAIDVEAFSTKDYTDITAVPEPSTWTLLGAGALLGGVAVVRRQRKAA